MSDTTAQHVGHCCVRHGCKYYQDEPCPVEIGVVLQAHPCEACTDEDEAEAIERKAVVQRSKDGRPFHTATKRTSLPHGLVRNEQMEFTGPDRIIKAIGEAKELAAGEPDADYRVVDIVITEHWSS